MKNFERFVAIDWSGAKSPIHSKSISVAAFDKNQNEAYLIKSPHKNGWSRRDVADWLISSALDGVRTLVGIDCNFGYAQSVGKRHCGIDYTGTDLWALVEKSCAADPNYFASGFWSHPNYENDFWLHGKSPQWFDAKNLRRRTEQACGEAGFGWPESPFKLIGAKQVGKGGLAGMRMAHDLKKRTGTKIAFWPFESDQLNISTLVITEIYPRLFLRMAGFGNRKVRTISELNEILAFLGANPYKGDDASDNIGDHDTDALVSAAGLGYLCGDNKAIPPQIAAPVAMNQVARQREGWIFGVHEK